MNHWQGLGGFFNVHGVSCGLLQRGAVAAFGLGILQFLAVSGHKFASRMTGQFSNADSCLHRFSKGAQYLICGRQSRYK
jgi:hypothetical protein